jgi:hypothetical protein
MTIAWIVKGRRSVVMQRIDMGVSLAFFAVLIWTILGGPVFVGAPGDHALKGFLVVIAAFALIDLGNKLVRGMRAGPAKI